MSCPVSLDLFAIKSCIKCSDLCQSRSQVVIHKYKTSNTPLMLIGEAPGATEDELGMPFMGVSGKVLDSYLEQYELDRLAYVTNAVKCRPLKNRTPTKQEVSSCLPYLVDQIQSLSPLVIATLGNVARDALLLAAQNSYISSLPYTHVHIYHPSYFLRKKNMLKPAQFSEFEADYSAKFRLIKSILDNHPSKENESKRS